MRTRAEPLNAALLGRQVGQGAKAGTSPRTPNHRRKLRFGCAFAVLCALLFLSFADALTAADKTPNEKLYQLNKGTDPNADSAALPAAPSGFEVKLVAREPLVRNPCSLAFDDRGRIFVGHGPQYRKPTPDTPPDSIVLLLDDDDDGVFDRAKTFATGFNCIQGLAWRGRDLYVANSPDLTIVRDLDGDDEADEYVKLYTDLGNIEHALHGLNFAPDGRLYMSKGNSKGLSQPGRVAPKPFRDLWGIGAPPGAPDFPPPQTFKKAEYKATYQNPDDDWGREGGVLRCDPDGSGLEIVARGLRNPWDITFNDTFDWLGSDNDQTPGDRFFMPFPGAHFGWNHSWSSSWTGANHPSTAPASGPLFDGSGTGVAFYDAGQFPPSHQGVFFVGDWLRKVIYLYRPAWDGARLLPSGGAPEDFIRGRNALFRPTDLGVGPDGALYVLGWGRAYGGEFENGQQINEGRVFRIAWKDGSNAVKSPKRRRPLPDWTFAELADDLGAALPVWRVNAADELLRRGSNAANNLIRWLAGSHLTLAQQTWGLWTLGRIAVGDAALDRHFIQLARNGSFNQRLQSLRVLGHRASRAPIMRSALGTSPHPEIVTAALKDPEPRLRLAAVLAIRDAHDSRSASPLWELAATESDRIVFYAAWQTLRELVATSALQERLGDARAGARRAALLALLESRALKPEEVSPLMRDRDTATAALARLFLEKSGVLAPAVAATELSEDARPLPRSARNPEPPPKPPGRPTTIEDVLPLVAGADQHRGEWLVLGEGGAGCWVCHRTGQRGRQFGPDLSAIGDRGDARHLVESILAPNAIVTEGFATLQVSTRNDDELAGLLLEETDSMLTLAMASGPPVRVPKDRITGRQSLHTSPMPSFADALNPLDTAAIVSWLLIQRSRANDAAAPLGAEERIPRAAATNDSFTFERGDGQLRISRAGRPVTTYVFRDEKILRPYFANVHTLDGVQVTRRHPPVAGQDATDHDTMHPGVWLAFGDLSGQDFWRNKGRVEHERFIEPPIAEGDKLRFAVANRYIGPEGQFVCREVCRIQMSALREGLFLIWDSTFQSDEGDFVFGDQEEMGLGVRVATELTVKTGGGTIENSAGARNQKETWGKIADWSDYFGVKEGRRVGALLMAGRGNFRSNWFHNRDYGVMVANPFGRKAFTGGETSAIVVKRGEPFRLHFGVLFHSSPPDRPLDRDKAVATLQAALQRAGR